MATNCEACGHKTNEIKSGSGIAEKGIKIILKVDNDNILKYDVVRVSVTLQVKRLKLINFFKCFSSLTLVLFVFRSWNWSCHQQVQALIQL